MRPALAISESDHAVLVDADSDQIRAAKLISLGAVAGYVLLAGGNVRRGERAGVLGDAGHGDRRDGAKYLRKFSKR